MSEPQFYLQGRTIYKKGKVKVNSDGSQNIGMNFKVCEVDEFIEEPEALLLLLNLHRPLVDALKDCLKSAHKQEADLLNEVAALSPAALAKVEETEYFKDVMSRCDNAEAVLARANDLRGVV